MVWKEVGKEEQTMANGCKGNPAGQGSGDYMWIGVPYC